MRTLFKVLKDICEVECGVCVCVGGGGGGWGYS